MTTINCTTLNASVAVNTANVNVSNTVTSNSVDCTDLTSTGSIQAVNIDASGTFTVGNIVASGISIPLINADQITTPLLQVDTIAGNLTPDEIIVQSGVVLRVNDISGAIQTNFHKDIVMDETVPADIHVPAGSTLFTNTLTPNSGTSIILGGDADLSGNDLLNVNNLFASGLALNLASTINMQGNSIQNINDTQTTTISATNTTNIVCNNRLDMTQDIVMGNHDIQSVNAIQINTNNGGGNVQIHSIGGSAQCNVQVDTNGDLIADNLTSTFQVGLFRPRYWESAITLGVVQTTLAVVSTVYSLLGSWGTPASVGYGWTVDQPVANSWRLTYNGGSNRSVRLQCDMTYSTSAPDQFELGFYKNATISGGNVISTGPIDGSFHRINNTGLTLPRNSFHVITTVAPNDTFMIGVQCATIAGVVFQAISASWSVEDFSNGSD